jgi:hypothetical protein
VVCASLQIGRVRKRDAPPKGGALWGTTGRRDADPRAWICRKSLDQGKSGPLLAAQIRCCLAQLAHRLLGIALVPPPLPASPGAERPA